MLIIITLVLDIQAPAVRFSGLRQQQFFSVYLLFRLRIIVESCIIAVRDCYQDTLSELGNVTFDEWSLFGGPRLLLYQRTALCLTVSASLLGHDDLFCPKKIMKVDLRCQPRSYVSVKAKRKASAGFLLLLLGIPVTCDCFLLPVQKLFSSDDNVSVVPLLPSREDIETLDKWIIKSTMVILKHLEGPRKYHMDTA